MSRNNVDKSEGDQAAFAKSGLDGDGHVTVAVKKPNKSCGRVILFERSQCLRKGCLVWPQYDSPRLESYFQECAYPEARNHMRFGLIFIVIFALVWAIYSKAVGINSADKYLIIGVVLALVSLIIFIITFVPQLSQAKWLRIISSFWAVFLVLITLILFVIEPVGLSYVMMMGMCALVVLIIYTLVPTPLSFCFLLGLLLSVVFEALLSVMFRFNHLLIPRIVMQVGLHVIGFYLHLERQILRRSTFMKLCESARSKKEMRMEEDAKQKMIRSLMPEKVAQEVMAGEKKRNEDNEEDECREHGQRSPNTSSYSSQSQMDDDDAVDRKEMPDPEDQTVSKPSVVTFRKFHVNQMKNVSILYADIVGFTKMSSNKTAPHLVYLLNDLFGRFDKLCELNGNEKIATLGDCYYCVAGCPDSVEDHAERCVEMGRSMCLAIQQFDKDHSEEVNMRVGVHTGMVICGIVGTRRFKFDVWSNDVNLANEMESSGLAGKVHISESTLDFVKELYDVEQGEPVRDIRKIKVLIEYFDETDRCYKIKHTQDKALIQTYFILERKDGKQPISLQGTNPDDNAEVTNTEEKNAERPMLTDKSGDVEESGSADGGRRESSDSDLVDDMRSEKGSAIFYNPPVSSFTLNFDERAVDKKFRNLGLRQLRHTPPLTTLSSPRLSRLVDAVVYFILIILINIACLAFGSVNWAIQIPILIISLVSCVPVLVLLILGYHRRSPKEYANFFNYNLRHIYGILLFLLPAGIVLARLEVCSLNYDIVYSFGFFVLFFYAICNSTIFTMYSIWLKATIPLVLAEIGCLIAFLTLEMIPNCDWNCPRNQTNDMEVCNATLVTPVFQSSWKYLSYEFVATIHLILILVFFLNYTYEISHRLNFYCDRMALREKAEINNAKKQADWLLENIIPHYIIQDLKTTKKYSQHMTDVGVVFATLSNFSQFYDEQFEGGREMLRVLNEIFADFEHLLELPRFKDVEKIKTIGACFMAASGLNAVERERNDHRKQPDAHLYALVDFSLALLETLEEFNQQIFNFDFELKIGYNIGDVTAGVIGTTKLLYDIWGDTVNVASRMYSTGETARIQVTKSIADRLSDVYNFEYRDMIEVKGKGKMETYLLIGKKSKS